MSGMGYWVEGCYVGSKRCLYPIPDRPPMTFLTLPQKHIMFFTAKKNEKKVFKDIQSQKTFFSMKIIKRVKAGLLAPESSTNYTFPQPVSGFVMSPQYSGGPARMHVVFMLRLPYYHQRIGGTFTILYSIAIIISVNNVSRQGSKTKKLYIAVTSEDELVITLSSYQ